MGNSEARDLVDSIYTTDKSKLLGIALRALKEAREDCQSDEEFIMHCVGMIRNVSNYTSLPEVVQSIKDLIKDSYPEHWNRIEKLLILK